MRLLPNRRASIDQAPVALRSVLVRQAIHSLQSRMLNTGSDGYERVPLALSVIPPKFAEGTSGISPQHLNGIFLPACTEQDGCFHLSRLLVRFDSHGGVHLAIAETCTAAIQACAAERRLLSLGRRSVLRGW